MSDNRWRDQARCAGRGLNTMFPEDRNSPGSDEYKAEMDGLRQVFCWKCPVRAECLADGMAEDFGVWGGLDPSERRKAMQLTCYCGQPIDPKDMLSQVRRHFCPDHVPLQFVQ